MLVAMLSAAGAMFAYRDRIAEVFDVSVPSVVAAAEAPKAAAPAPETEEAKVARLTQAKESIAELRAAFARHVKAPRSERERYLRYDCARMERLSFDVDEVDHPLAKESREKLAKLETTYGDKCRQALARAKPVKEDAP